MKRMRQAFTLMEVNLAIFIMATGVLGMVSLYSLGFRESRQSEEDVASAGLADAFLSPLVTGLSATNMTWSGWCQAVPHISSEACNGLAPQLIVDILDHFALADIEDDDLYLAEIAIDSE